MYLSAKSEYGIMAALDLELARGQAPVRARAIAERQSIPIKCLEHILRELRNAGLVESTRGAQGGYRLAKAAEEIKLGDVIQAVEGPIATVPRNSSRNGNRHGPNGDGHPLTHETVVQNIWEEVNDSIRETLNGTTLADLCGQIRDLEGQGVLMYHI
jgi:Rrf2 family cysteine metabolism transcriptional repressor